MIKVNNRDYDWDGRLTIQDIMDELKYTYPVLIVTVNGKHIEREEYGTTIVNDGDDVKILHPVCGG